MNAARERKLTVAQRRMLRKIVKVGRRPLKNDSWSDEGTHDEASDDDDSTDSDMGETWVEWIKRATKTAEELSAKAKVTDWIEGQRKRKWGFAGHTMRRDDGRWSRLLLEWRPIGNRSVGHPKTRWTDVLEQFSDYWNFIWQDKAQSRLAWARWTIKFDAWR
jgi:hypothetical protein